MVNDTQFLVSYGGNIQYIGTSHPVDARFFLCNLNQSEPVYNINISHMEQDIKSIKSHHLFCMLPNQSIAYYSSPFSIDHLQASAPSQTLIVATPDSQMIYKLNFQSVAVDYMLPYSNSEVLLSTLTGIYLYNFTSDTYNLLYFGNYKMGLAYINASSDENERIVDMLSSSLRLPRSLMRIISGYY